MSSDAVTARISPAKPLGQTTRWLGLLALVLTLADLYLIFLVAPADAVLGQVQRIFYIHVPMAVLSFLAFFLVFVGSLVFLMRRTPRWDRLAHAATEIGVVLVTLALLTGIIWARPVWGVWWTWEPRLTTTLILWLIYVACLMVRAYAPSRSRGAVYAAVVGIIGFADVPIVYYSVQWWRSIHPAPVVGPLAEAGALEPIMLAIFLFSLAAFLVVFLYLLLQRIAVRRLEDQAAGVRLASGGQASPGAP